MHGKLGFCSFYNNSGKVRLATITPESVRSQSGEGLLHGKRFPPFNCL